MAADPAAANGGGAVVPAGAKDAKVDGITQERWYIYSPLILSTLGKDSVVTNVKSIVEKSDEKDSGMIENIQVTTKDGKSQNIELTCNICYDDYTPGELIEYTFNDNDWFLSSVCETCLGYYKEKKFGLWQEHILKPVCEASFRRLLKIGVITTMFDHLAFPSPDSEKEKYQVKDDNGKIVPIPRPVLKMRNWDCKNGKYQNINIHLKGAPKTKEEKDKLWNDMIDEFNKKYGKVMIDEWLKQ